MQMDPHLAQFGGGAAHTYLNPYVLALLVLAGIFIIFSTRQRALVAMLTVGILIPMDQVLVIGGLHFPSIRILILFGFIRMLREKFGGKTEIFSGGLNKIDKAVIGLIVFTAIDGMLLWQASGELVFQLGNIYTGFGLYFLMRFLIREEADIRKAIRTLAYVSAFVAALATYERVTGYNLVYNVLNGARALTFETQFGQNDRVRAAVSFGHPILLGTYGAIILPMFAGLWLKYKTDRKVALLGILAAGTIAVCANSSTSLLGMFAGLLALSLWPLRKYLRAMRWGIVLMLISLHMVMKAPVWQLISRIDLTGGSSSDHRYQVLNQCIIHFTSWFLWGTKDYASWGWSMYDLGNQYVFVADTAGLIPLICFLAIIVMSFKYLGSARKAAEENGNKTEALYFWALCAMMLANVVAYFGI